LPLQKIEPVTEKSLPRKEKKEKGKNRLRLSLLAGRIVNENTIYFSF